MNFPARRVARSALWLFASRLAAQGLAALFTILVARRTGEAVLGEYAFIASVVFLANVATTFGTDMQIIRAVAADHNLGAIPAAIVVQLALSLPAIGLFWLFPGSWVRLSSEGVIALRIYSFALIPMSIINVISAGLRGLERMGFLAGLSVVGPALQVATTALLVSSHGVVFLAQLVLAAQVAAGLLAIILFLGATQGNLSLWKVSVGVVRSVAFASLPIALLGGLGILYQRAAIYLALPLAGAAATGWYSAASRVVEAPRVVQYALMGALLPILAQQHARPDHSRPQNAGFSGTFYLSLGLSIAAALVVFLAAQPVVSFLYGEAFAPATAILRTLAGFLIPNTVTNYVSIRLLAIGRERRLLAPLAVATLALFPACLWAFASWGMPGIAGAVVGVEWLLAGFYFVAWRKIAVLIPS